MWREGKLYALAMEDGEKAFKDGMLVGDCPHTDEVLREGWQHGWQNADRDAQAET
jgi:ribosome modulation factor